MSGKRRIVFDQFNGPLFFSLVYTAFRGRNPEKITKDERRHFAEIQRALESVSEAVGDLADDAEFDGRNRRLVRPGDCLLSQRAFDRLVTVVDETPYHAGLSLQVEQLLEHLAGSDRVVEEPEFA